MKHPFSLLGYVLRVAQIAIKEPTLNVFFGGEQLLLLAWIGFAIHSFHPRLIIYKTLFTIFLLHIVTGCHISLFDVDAAQLQRLVAK